MLQQNLHNIIQNNISDIGFKTDNQSLSESSLVFGQTPNHLIQRVYAVNPSTTTNNVEEFVSPLLKTFDLDAMFPGSELTLSLASESADDSNALGTGVKKVRIVGLDDNYDNLIQDVLTNGQTPVEIPLPIFRINDVFILEYGDPDPTNGTTLPNGNIWIGNGDFTDGVPANKFRGIPTTQTSSRDSFWSVSTTALLARQIRWLTWAQGLKTAEFNLYVRLFPDVGNVWLKAPGLHDAAVFDIYDILSDPLIAGVDLVVTVTAEQLGTSIGSYMVFDYLTGV